MNAEKHYQAIVIGAGPAGYVAAIRLAQLGMHTLCIDKTQAENGTASPGGTCLNVGCIPSKALLEISEHYHRAQHQFARFGIQTSDVRVDVQTMQRYKTDQVQQLTRGITSLFRSNRIDFVHADAMLMDANTVKLQPFDGEAYSVQGQNIILAPGSRPKPLAGVPCDHERIVDSTGALSLQETPKRLGIIGAGVIGLELGSVWARLGAEVTILEAMGTFLPPLDSDVSGLAMRQFKKQGLRILLGAHLSDVTRSDNQVHVRATHKDQSIEHTFDVLIVAIGREPNTSTTLGPHCGVSVDQRGFIHTDAHFHTGVGNVYAIGDAVGGAMLAHKASEEGVAVAEFLACGHKHVPPKAMPWIIYTNPEIAWAGASEHELKAQGIDCRVGTFPFAANARAKMSQNAEGFVKIIADAQTDRILGAQLIGPHVSELLAEIVLAFEYQASSEDLARTIHAHPTLSETIHEAALAVHHQALHIPAPKART